MWKVGFPNEDFEKLHHQRSLAAHGHRFPPLYLSHADECFFPDSRDGLQV
jgi:hypothetical protein